jgi:hypothetical protein
MKMKQKTRYNLRLARHGGRHHVGSLTDLGLLYHMYAETSNRDGFIIREEAYYLGYGPLYECRVGRAISAEVEGNRWQRWSSTLRAKPGIFMVCHARRMR